MGCDWYIAEWKGNDLFWGYTILNGNDKNAEWGYISFKELKELNVFPGIEVDRDLWWQPKPARKIEKITKV